MNKFLREQNTKFHSRFPSKRYLGCDLLNVRVEKFSNRYAIFQSSLKFLVLKLNTKVF